MVEVMLTTVDNPYSPFDSYDEWYRWDMANGYNTPGLLARVAKVSLELSDADISVEIENAIDEIVSENVLGLYRKVYKNLDEDKSLEE